MTIRTALVNSLIYPLSAARKPTLSSCDYEKVTSRSLVLAFVACCYSMSAPAQDYTPARTEWGQPDLQGVWNFSSDRPMIRPSQFGEREYFSDAEISRIKALAAARDANSDSALPIAGVDESYNDFWIENAGIGGLQRTSHLVYPKNGQLPPFADSAINQQGNYGGEDTGESRPARILAGGIGTDGPEDRGLSERCIVGFNSGPPFIPSLYNNNVQIFQSKEHVVLLTEMIHDARIVPLAETAAAHHTLRDDIRLWTGDSRGYWDGDTLVVITKNFNDLTTSFNAHGTAFDKVLTERFTRTAADTVDYEFTVDDPTTFTDKVVAIVEMTKVAGQLYEYACHEGNYGMVNILRGARAQEAREAD